MNAFSKALATLAALATMTFAAAAETVWDMPTPYPATAFQTVNIAAFVEEVAEATDGELTIKIHSAGSLFKHAEIMPAVRDGQVPIGELLMGLLANDDPAFGIDTLPFLATNMEEASKLWQAQRPVVESLLEEQGLRMLFAVPWPGQSLFTRKEVNTVADLKGLKFRTYNPISEQLARRAGAAPTQVEVPDIPRAFATGQVEAMITSPSTGVNSAAWDFVNVFTDIRAWLPKNMVVVNQRAFDKLDADVREAILAAAQRAEKRGWEMSEEETASKIAVLRENGVTIVEPSAELVAGLKEIGDQILEEWKASAGQQGEAILMALSGQ